MSDLPRKLSFVPYFSLRDANNIDYATFFFWGWFLGWLGCGVGGGGGGGGVYSRAVLGPMGHVSRLVAGDCRVWC